MTTGKNPGQHQGISGIMGPEIQVTSQMLDDRSIGFLIKTIDMIKIAVVINKPGLMKDIIDIIHQTTITINHPP